MPDHQDTDNFEIDELLRHRKPVRDQKDLDRKEPVKWCSDLRNLRDSLTRKRRLLATKLSGYRNFRQPFYGRSSLAEFVEIQAAIDAIERALPEEDALLKEHERWSAENDHEWA